MNTLLINKSKRNYSSPEIERVLLDNEISLALQSVPPGGPGESYLPAKSMQADPFKTVLG